MSIELELVKDVSIEPAAVAMAELRLLNDAVVGLWFVFSYLSKH